MVHIPEHLRSHLVGDDPSQLRRTLGVALGAFLVVAVIGLVGRAGGWVPGAFVHVTPLAVGITLGVLAIGCLAGGVNAARNGGLLPSWLLAGAPLTAWLGLYHADPDHPLSTLAVVTAVSLLVVPVAGTSAYAIGQFVRMRTGGDAGDGATDPVLRVLAGTDPGRAGHWGGVAVALSVVAVAGVLWDVVPVTAVSPFLAVGGASPYGTVVTLAWIGVAALPGYRQDGLVASWALLFGPLFGGLVTEAATDRFLHLPLLVDVATGGVRALVPTLVGGTLGFLLGAGIRRVAGKAREGGHYPGSRG